jgi:hypothetical protein
MTYGRGASSSGIELRRGEAVRLPGQEEVLHNVRQDHILFACKFYAVEHQVQQLAIWGPERERKQAKRP